MAETCTLRELPLVPILVLTFHTHEHAMSEVPEAVGRVRKALDDCYALIDPVETTRSP